eukprot:6212185-Amphidinium_carterae.1
MPHQIGHMQPSKERQRRSSSGNVTTDKRFMPHQIGHMQPSKEKQRRSSNGNVTIANLYEEIPNFPLG